MPIGGTESITVPDGIAHFLEHKMFEKEDGDVFQKFSGFGASANAFTSFTRTAYLFSSTNNIYNSTETLLNFVQEPYFTEATVNKEKGIIGQEITMYDDQPDWRLYFGTIENMYHNHPVKLISLVQLSQLMVLLRTIYIRATIHFITRPICYCLSLVQ